MGYNNSATTTTLYAKLTPIGRRKLILTNNNLITSFSFGDSDANYYASQLLTTGEVPGNGGEIGTNANFSNSVAPDVNIKSMLIVDGVGNLRKKVETKSSELTTNFVSLGQSVAAVSSSTITQNVINRNNNASDSLVNLFYSFNLPLNSNDDYRFTGLSTTLGGYATTAISGLAQSQIVVIGIGNSVFGELIDGKSIKLEISTTLPATYTIYSTFQNTGQSLQTQDANYTDKATNTSIFGSNVAFLVSDDIQRPNGGDPNLSWATGYNTAKPFSLYGKQQYNFVTDTNLNQNLDTLVGIAYLDKGFLVLTHPTITTFFDVTSTGTVVTISSVSTSVSQNITCIADKGEFGVSTNPTFTVADTPRISEVGLYDEENELIAIAKLDRHLSKNVNEFLALSIKLGI